MKFNNVCRSRSPQQISQIKLFITYYSQQNIIVNMISKQKKLSNGSEPTQPERSQRFSRRNSIHTLHCRQGSLKKYDYASQELFASTPHIQNHEPPKDPQKNSNILIQTQAVDKDLPPSFTPSLKRGSGSMKIDPTHHMHRGQPIPAHQCETLQKQLQTKTKENEHLQLQCNRYKIYLTEQKQKRKILQQQIRCNRQQIKRLQKRLQKYKIEKDKYQSERQAIIKHIDELQAVKFDSNTRQIQSYQMQIINQQVARLRQELSKDRSARQKELLQQVEKYIQSKYGTECQLKSANIANITLTKQIQQLQSQMQILQSSIHKAVTESYEYQQLRQKYRIMLVEFKQLREEMSLLEANRSSSVMSNTLLTVSGDDLLQQ